MSLCLPPPGLPSWLSWLNWHNPEVVALYASRLDDFLHDQNRIDHADPGALSKRWCEC